VEKALHPLNRLLKMKTLATREKRAQAAVATMAVMVTKLLGTKGILRRLTSRTRYFSEIFAPQGCFCIFVHSLSFSALSEQAVL
jgi:hypothetical protein